MIAMAVLGAGVGTLALARALAPSSPKRQPAEAGDEAGTNAPRTMRLPGYRARERRALAAGLAELVEGLARSVRAGSSIRGALATAANTTAGPLGDDLARIATRLDNGASVAEVLEEWRTERHDIGDVGLVATALTIAAGTGGSVARALDGVADTIRGEQHLRAEVRALASQAEASALLVAVLPIVFGLVAGAADPRTVAFLTTTATGLGCLVIGLALDGGAWWWMRRITSAVES